MRAALWLLALFGVAVAIALFAGNNQGTVTVFWPPYRIDLSLNLVLLLAVAGFVLLHVALRALSALFNLPREAMRWRNQQKERTLQGQLVDAIAHLSAGRFLRARKSADAILMQERSLQDAGVRLTHATPLRALAHLLAAESAQFLQDRAARDEHLRLSLEHSVAREAQGVREGALMRAARWALDDRDPQAAGAWLAQLPQGAARRTLALRMKLRADRLEGRTLQALETTRLLAKHRALSPQAAQSLVRGLATDLLNAAHDISQLQRTWAALEPGEQDMPDLAIHAALRVASLRGDATLAREWLLPVWSKLERLDAVQKVRMVHAFEKTGLDSIDGTWLARFETAHRADPRDATLQYLAGMACVHRHLWGKAQQLLTQATQGLADSQLQRQAWSALARLAEDRGDADAAAQAWKRAANS